MKTNKKELGNMKYLNLLVLVFWTGLIMGQGEPDESRYISNTRQLIYEGNRSGEGYFSQDGRYLIFQSEREEDNPFYQIYMLDFETGDVNRVSPGYGKTTCSYFQWGDGDRVMFASSHLDPDARKKQQDELDFRASGKKKKYSWDYEEQMDIFSCKRDGSDIIQLTDELGYDAEGAYSPDGKLIVFASNRNAYERELTEEEKAKFKVDKSYFLDVFVMNADGSNVKQLTDVPGYDGGTFFSPDGEKIIWRRFSEDGHTADVYTMDVDGSNEQRITNFGCLSWAPFYHPSMEYIIFAANKEGFANFELFIVDVEGSKEPVRVTFTDGFDGLPVFSPDGRQLVWTSSRTSNGKAQLFIGKWKHEAALKALETAPFRDQENSGVHYNFSNDITENDLKTKVIYLASDELEGRMTGSKGAQMAADYIAGIFENLDLKPFPEQQDYFVPFDFIADFEISKEKNKILWGRRTFELDTEFMPFSTSENGLISSEIVFAGYGMKIEKPDYSYNSYQHIDVKDKIVMVLTGIPEGLDQQKKDWFERAIASGHKQMLAKQMGAKALIVVSDRSLDARLLETGGSAGLMMVKISEAVADEMFREKETGVDELKKALAGGDPASLKHLFSLEGELTLETEVNKVIGSDNNVIGFLPSNNKGAQYIFIGGHYDHLGLGETNSRADAEHSHDIHNGADDNASGTATVIELAEYYAGLFREDKNQIHDNLVFCLWSGEELGLLGSSAFAEKLKIPSDQVKAYLNFDMVGRLNNNQLELQGLGSADEWKKIIEKKNIVTGFDLQLSEDPYLPTDATSFYLKKIPVLSFFTGIHMDYHTDRDDAEFLNYPGMQRITKFASLVINELMNPKQTITYKAVKMKASKGSRGNASITLGTIPQYAAGNDKGMRIQGVREGAPAEKAGIMGGDVVVGMAGKEVNDIYDFMNIMGEMKADQEYEIIVIRDGKELKLTIIPETK